MISLLGMQHWFGVTFDFHFLTVSIPLPVIKQLINCT
jgi:hypothetical protein